MIINLKVFARMLLNVANISSNRQILHITHDSDTLHYISSKKNFFSMIQTADTQAKKD